MNKDKIFNNSEFDMLDVNLIRTAKYQDGRLNVSRAKKIAKDFDIKKAGVIIVSHRERKYFVVDGQHRTAAASIADVPRLMCQILHDLTYQEEAMLFAEQDENKRSVSAFDKFKARIEGEEPKALDIKNVANSLGIKINDHSRDNEIRAVGTLEKIYDKQGIAGLEKCLKLIQNTWSGENKSFSANILKGVAELIKRYQFDIDEKLFVSQLRRVDVNDIIMQAKSATYHYDPVREAYAKVMLKYYNRNLRTNRLKWAVE